MIIALVVVAVLVIAGGVTAIVLLTGDDDPTPTASTNTAPVETSSGEAPASSSEDQPTESEDSGGGADELPDATSPEGLGDDPALDSLAQDCFDGDMGACDTLFLTSDIDSEYETYGATCGGRLPEDEATGLCVFTFP
jgi:hypothetical protein